MTKFKKNDIVKGNLPGLHIIQGKTVDGYVIDNSLNVLTDTVIARDGYKKVGRASFSTPTESMQLKRVRKILSSYSRDFDSPLKALEDIRRAVHSPARILDDPEDYDTL